MSCRLDVLDVHRGVCPQHDILWNELSAREHLRMFCKFKRIAGLNISEEVERRLQDVDLDKVGDKLVGTFSGGMKRRLSVAISAIGDPKIIFMDEPTTGMDPASRRQVWQLIRNMKEGRVILLTTHSMEEADTLSDRIGIMAFGGLRCLGTSLRMKTRFGDGYHLNLVTEPRNAEKVKAMVHQLAPDAKVLSENAGNLIFNIPFGQEKKLANIFQFVEKDLQEDESDRLVKDWGISHTTLEEVYLKVTNEADFGYGSGQKNATTGAVIPTHVRGSIYRASRQSIVIGQPMFAQPYQTGVAAGTQPVTYQAVAMGVPIGR
jgi:ABC-type multidrug transport system ATPase subunit